MRGSGIIMMCLLISTSVSSAPAVRSLANMVSIDTRGLEVPTNFLAASGSGTGALQIVVNVRTDSLGNIEVITN